MSRSLALLFVVSSLGVACSRAAAPSGNAESTSVTLTASDVAEARVASVTDGVSISGALEPSQTVVLKSQVNAIVRAVHADRGSRVRRGEVLVEFDAQGLRGQAAGAKAAIAAADANLALASQRYESAQRLNAAGGISALDLRIAEAGRKVAEAQAAAARAQGATTSESESKATIASPIDGVVSDRAIEPGEAAREGGVLLTVVETRTLELRAQVGVDEAMRVKPGAAVLFTLDAAPGETFHGRVTRVDPRADPATRQVGIASTLPNPDRRIVAGQFAHGRVLTAAPAPQVVVPVTAVSDSAGHATLFVIENGRLTRRAIVLGVHDDALGLVGVRSGLKVGERVLAVPVLGAAEGLAVKMATDAQQPRAGTPPEKAR